MIAQGPLSVHGPALRCDHCGRPVHETIHTRTGYRVDYYSLHTGPVELARISTDNGEPVEFQRLLSRVEVVTCAECYLDEAVQRTREERFRPERTGDQGAPDGE